MFSRLSFPPPHRLAGNTRHRACSVSAHHLRPTPTTNTTSKSDYASTIHTDTASYDQPITTNEDIDAISTYYIYYTHCITEDYPSSDEQDDCTTETDPDFDGVPVEDVDSAVPPQAKRLKHEKVQHIKRDGHTKKKHQQPIVQSFDGKPLKSFSLFLPHDLPASIIIHPTAFVSYTLTTAATYLSLWSFDIDMDVVDVRSPKDYSKHDHHFVRAFIKVVLNALSGVQSVKELYLPQVIIRDQFCSGLKIILKALSKQSCMVANLFLPIAFTIECSVLKFSKIAKAVKAISSVEKVTFISDKPEFLDSLKEAVGESPLHFSSLLSDNTSVPGPAYIANLGKSVPVIDEVIHPTHLIASLNTGRISIIDSRRSTTSRASGDGGVTTKKEVSIIVHIVNE